MIRNQLGRFFVVGALAMTAVVSQAQFDRHSYQYGHVARFDWGQSDDKPRLNDPSAMYLWHDRNTFYVAVGPEARGSVYVRADVLRGTIENISHRTQKEWMGRGGRDDRREWDASRFDRGWDNQGVRQVSPDVIEYAARGGSWDIIRFDVRRGENIRFNFDPSHNDRNSRTIYIGGEKNRQTRSETVQIDFKGKR